VLGANVPQTVRTTTADDRAAACRISSWNVLISLQRKKNFGLLNPSKPVQETKKPGGDEIHRGRAQL
jgi:hypothetical protein